MVDAGLALSPTEFRDRFALGGYWWTMRVNQMAGAYLARAAIRGGFHPNQVSLATTATGIVTTASVVALYGTSPLLAGLIGLVGWQLSYSLDCADGQVARATDQASPRGALLDLLCDFLIHVAVVFAALHVVSTDVSGEMTLITVPITAAWLIAPYYKGILELLPAEMKAEGDSGFYNVVRHARDFGVYVAVLPVAIMMDAHLVLGFLVVTSVLEFAALARGIWSYSRHRMDS